MKKIAPKCKITIFFFSGQEKKTDVLREVSSKVTSLSWEACSRNCYTYELNNYNSVAVLGAVESKEVLNTPEQCGREAIFLFKI